MSNSIRWAADAWEAGRVRDEDDDTREGPETGQDDGLDGFRGLMVGLAAATAFWLVLLAAAWVLS
jgi:hypothetical protein